MRIKVNTHFDITQTGITRPFKGQQLPARVNNQLINDRDEWAYKRNQQNNFDTVIQCLLLRAQPQNITTPKFNQGIWSFVFEVENTDVYGKDFKNLIIDSTGIPMMTGLNETLTTKPYLNEEDIWFEQDV